MKRNFLWFALLVFAQFFGLVTTAIALPPDTRLAKVINRSAAIEQVNGGTEGRFGANGYVFDFSSTHGGGRYIFRSQAKENGGYVKVGRGLRMVLENFSVNGANVNNSGYTYTGPLLSGDYVADSTHSSQSDVVIAGRVGMETFKKIVEHNLGRIEGRLASANTSPVQVSVAGLNLVPNSTGMSAGDAEPIYGVWAQVGWSHIKNTDAASEFRANLYSGTVGADMKLMDEMLVGLSYTFDIISDGKTFFNQGTFKQKAHSVTPYIGYRFDDCLGIDAMGGYGYVDKDFDRTQGFFTGTTYNFIEGDMVKASSVKAHRWFFGIFGNAAYVPVEDLTLSVRAGYRYIHEKQKAYDADYRGVKIPHDSLKSKVGTLSARLRAAYLIEKWFEPFVQGAYEYDANLTTQTFTDGPALKREKSGYMLGGGFHLYGADNWTGLLEATHRFGHGKLRITTVAARVRYVF